MTDYNDTKKPEKIFRDGTMKATMWRNAGKKDENGRQAPDYFSTDLSKSYRDRAGEWKETRNFSGSDLLKVEKLSSAAYEHERLLKEQDREERKERFKDQREKQAQKRTQSRERSAR